MILSLGSCLFFSYYLHGQDERVENDGGENAVLEAGRRDEPPDLVLNGVLGYVLLDGLGLERELNALSLVLVERAVLELLLALVLKRNDHKTDENVDHEECDDHNVGDEKYGNGLAVVVDRALVLFGRVDRLVEEPFY